MRMMQLLIISLFSFFSDSPSFFFLCTTSLNLHSSQFYIPERVFLLPSSSSIFFFFFLSPSSFFLLLCSVLVLIAFSSLFLIKGCGHQRSSRSFSNNNAIDVNISPYSLYAIHGSKKSSIRTQ